MNETIPSGKLKLSYRDAEYFIKNVVVNWKPKSEVWHFKYGNNGAAVMSCISASYIVYNVRKELKLRNYARLTCYLPVAGLSCYLAETVQDHVITPRVLTGRSCPMCVSMYAAALQMSLGVAYPLVIAPLIGFYLSDKLLTYPVPSISRAPGELLRLWWKLVSKNPRPLFASAVLQGAVIFYITQVKQFFVMDYVAKSRSLC